jgi:hypothetical protein
VEGPGSVVVGVFGWCRGGQAFPVAKGCCTTPCSWRCVMCQWGVCVCV